MKTKQYLDTNSVFCSHNDSWAWVPPLGGLVGAIVGSFIYQLLVGNHLLDDEQAPRFRRSREPNHVPVTLKSCSPSMDSVKTVSTIVDANQHFEQMQTFDQRF